MSPRRKNASFNVFLTVLWYFFNLQICLFGLDRFSLVTFLENNQLALKHLFLKEYQSDDKVVVYTKDQLFNYLHYAHEQVSPSQR